MLASDPQDIAPGLVAVAVPAVVHKEAAFETLLAASEVVTDYSALLGSLEELFVEFEAVRVVILKSLEGLSAESVADLVVAGVLHSTEELLIESEADLGTFALLGLPEMLFAELEVEVAKVASLEEPVALSLGTGSELQAAATAVAAVRSERQYLPVVLLEATLEVDLAQVGLVAELAAVVVAPLRQLVAAGVELVPEVDLRFVGALSGLVWLVVEGTFYMCEDIYSAIPGRHCKEPVWDYTHLLGP